MNPDGGSDMAANSWPGFVDILSAVVIMFVFFVLITAAVLYFYTIQYKAKVEGNQATIIEETVSSGHAKKVEELEQENQELRKQIEEQESSASRGGGANEVETPSDTQSAQSFGAQVTEQSLLSSTEERSLVIFHDPGAITISEDSAAEISLFLENMAAQYGADKLEVVLTSPKIANAATQSRAKRMAVARMLNVRNALLESPVNRESINLTVVESEEIEESDEWTRLQINILP